MLVLDASAALAWAMGDERRSPVEMVERLTEEPVIVPTHWILEVTNGLRVGVLRGRLQPDEPLEVLARIRNLLIRVDPETPVRGWQETPVLAARFGLTTYDAAYLELALRMDAPLATLDQDLARAAREAGVPLFE
jgi:predicted nucleic acid-binding protein